MEILSIPQASATPPNMPIIGLRGKVKSIFERKTGESDKGPWSFQDAILTDGAMEVRLKFKNCDPFDTGYKGQEVVLQSNNGKHGWTGIKMIDDEYNGKKTKKIVITPSCTIQTAAEYESGQAGAYDAGDQLPGAEVPAKGPGSGMQAVVAGGKAKLLAALLASGVSPEEAAATVAQMQPAASVAQPAPAPAKPVAPVAHAAPGPVSNVGKAKIHLAQAGNLYLLCLSATEYISKTFAAKFGVGLSSDHLQACCSTLFINADHAGLVAQMPAKPLPDFAPEKEETQPPEE